MSTPTCLGVGGYTPESPAVQGESRFQNLIGGDPQGWLEGVVGPDGCQPNRARTGSQIASGGSAAPWGRHGEGSGALEALRGSQDLAGGDGWSVTGCNAGRVDLLDRLAATIEDRLVQQDWLLEGDTPKHPGV